MRISDWSSDVCSSDLMPSEAEAAVLASLERAPRLRSGNREGGAGQLRSTLSQRDEPRPQHADRIAAHDGADFVVAEPRADQRLRYLNEPRRVEAHGGGAIILAAERDIVDADEGEIGRAHV